MKHLFIPYELAVIAKEKGFNEPCLATYYYSDKHLDMKTFQGMKNSEIIQYRQECSIKS